MARWLGDRLRSTGGFILLMAATVTVGTAVANALVVTDTEDRLTARLDDRVLSQARTTAAAIRVVDPVTQQSLIESSEVGGRDSALMTINAAGQVETLAPSGPQFAPDPPPDLPSYADLRAGVGTVFSVPGYRVGVVLLTEDRLLAVAGPTRDIEAAVSDLTRIVTLAGMTTLGAILAFTTLIIVVARRPITDAIAVAEAVGAGNLTAHVDERATTRDTRRLGRALNRMVDQLAGAADRQRATERKLREFVANAGHELRTPLTSIRGYAELMKSGTGPPTPQVAQAVERIEAASDRMAQLISELLELAELDGSPRLTTSRVDLSELVEASAVAAQHWAGTRTINVSVPAGPITVKADRDRLTTAVDHLLRNAVEHTPDESPVEVELACTPTEATVWVRDSGPGMSAEDAENVFDHFWRSDGSRSRMRGGSGIGLSLVKATAEAHGGMVRLVTSPGQGAAFGLVLPCDPGVDGPSG